MIPMRNTVVLPYDIDKKRNRTFRNLKEKYDFENMDYEEAIKIIEQQNDELFEMFMQSLMDKGLSEKTIRNHCSNV